MAGSSSTANRFGPATLRWPSQSPRLALDHSAPALLEPRPGSRPGRYGGLRGVHHHPPCLRPVVSRRAMGVDVSFSRGLDVVVLDETGDLVLEPGNTNP